MEIFHGVLIYGVLYAYTPKGNSFSVKLDPVFTTDEILPVEKMSVQFVFTSQYRAEIIFDFGRIR